MKIIDGMLLKEIAGNTVVVPTGKALTVFSGVIRLNKTGVDVWNGIAEGLSVEQIAEKLTKKYDVDLEIAVKTSQDFINKFIDAGIVSL